MQCVTVELRKIRLKKVHNSVVSYRQMDLMAFFDNNVRARAGDAVRFVGGYDDN